MNDDSLIKDECFICDNVKDVLNIIDIKNKEIQSLNRIIELKDRQISIYEDKFNEIKDYLGNLDI
jgi:hypothetical protein